MNVDKIISIDESLVSYIKQPHDIGKLMPCVKASMNAVKTHKATNDKKGKHARKKDFPEPGCPI